MKVRPFILAAAILLLDVSLTFENVWPTPAVRWRGAVSIELAVCLVVMTLTSRRRSWSPASIAWLSGVWTALFIGRYADVTAPALYGRGINLYWDLQFMPDVAAMITRVTPLWIIIVSMAAAVVVLWLVYRTIRWAWTVVNDAMTSSRQRRVLTGLSLAAIALFAIDRAGATGRSWVFRGREYQDEAHRLFPKPVTATYAHQARLVADALSSTTALPASPTMDSDLSRVKDCDVFVIFVESYGAAAFERPEIAAALTASRAQFESAIHATHRDVVSAYVESPTYGGSSWLAHVSVLSGIEVREAGANARLMTERRDTLVRAFGRQGFRTVALMPGLRGPWLEGAFYGFNEIYGADRLAYTGPEFGWFAVPDQYSLRRLDVLEFDRAARPPLFVFFPTISPHFPFSPTPPYQPDWARLSTHAPYDGGDIVSAYAHEPDWVHFAPGYVDAMAYDFASIGGYLRLHAGRDVVMVVLGDHQPPALVSGEGAPWDVPVHIIASRADVLERLVTSGFRRGLAPSRPPIGRMHSLATLMLDAFGERHGHPAPNGVRSKS